MSRLGFLTGVLALALIATGTMLALRQWPAKAHPTYPDSRTIRYSFTLQNTTGQPLRDADFWTFAPVKQTSWQKTEQVTASEPFELSEDEDGNQVLHFRIRDLAPYASRLIRIEAKIRLAQWPNRFALADAQRYLSPQPYVEVGAPQIRNAAARLRRESYARTAAHTEEWVHKTIRYAGYIRDDRGALYALTHRKGDCTEYAYLATALLRANGIPARAIGGYVLREDGVLHAASFHNWTELYLDGRWRIADPQNGAFLDREADYVEMRVIGSGPRRDLTTHRFAFAGNGLRVHMN